ncbi:arginyltransferase [Campylobacter lanienae]|uniref:arginyltransferase n=1 Tax=Campylobacter lanienae TaxID=75658 RepID=UPI000BB41A4C|nr:arginyltransferase [Campylobacter lanienae]
MTEIEFSTLDTPCAYLAGKRSRSSYKYIFNASFAYNSTLVEHGYRRFGKYFSKPICDGCSECKSLRIDAEKFKFTKSLRRVISKNNKANIEVIIARPHISDNHIKLYEKYHKFMQNKRGWEFHPMSYERYYSVYVEGAGEFGFEVDYYDGDRLICVDLIDITADGISSIYCFWDIDYAYLSLGKYSLLNQILIAKAHKLPWIYLGFYVKDCESLEYKSDYKPYQILQDYSELDELAVWLDD